MSEVFGRCRYAARVLREFRPSDTLRVRFARYRKKVFDKGQSSALLSACVGNSALRTREGRWMRRSQLHCPGIHG
jgi:hypothetical protein